ncbi:MAG: DUF2255 family protein [Chloroflexota bacterium]
MDERAWDGELLALIDGAVEVDIETTAADGTPHRATIWAVVDGGDAFVRSWKGERGRWYREIRDRPAGVLHVAGRAISVRAEPATDPTSVGRVSDALVAKYGRRSRASTEGMLLPATLPTTLRLVPTA